MTQVIMLESVKITLIKSYGFIYRGVYLVNLNSGVKVGVLNVEDKVVLPYK